MSIPQVGQGAFAVVPTFKGFRKTVIAESDAAAAAADKGFKRAFSKTGSEAGRTTGQGFKKAFESGSAGFSNKATRELEDAVAKSARAVSAARLKEQDAAGKVRLAERQLAEAREKYASDSSQVIRAEERLATASRQLGSAQDIARESTNDLQVAQSRLALAADRAGDQLTESGRSGARKFASGFTEIFKGSFLGSALGNLASSLTSQIGFAIGNGLRQGIDFALGTVGIASDLNESVNAVTVSYGSLADEIFKLGENSATTFGLSKRDLNSYAVQFSAFSKTIAGEGGDVAGTFQSILGRATDFASVMNLEVSEALGLFQSGLAGETEPLRRYGIDLSAARVEAYALANGIGDGSAELTEAQKQQARYGALLAQTSAVQGDFANTSSELANKNRINAATWDDLQAKIGTGFLPIAGDLARILSDEVFPVLEKLVDEHGPEMAAAFAGAVPALTELARVVLPELPGLFLSISDTIPGVIRLVGDLTPTVAFITGLFLGWQSVLASFYAFLSGDITLEQFVDKLLSIPGPIGDIIQAVYDLSFNTTAQLWNLQATVRNALGGIGTWLTDSGKALIGGFIDGINQMFRPVGDAVSGILEWVQGFFPNSPAKRGPLSGSGWARLGKSGGALMEHWTSGMARPDLTGVLSLDAVTGARSVSARRLSGAGEGSGDSYHFYGVTDSDAIAEAIERKKRRRVYRSGAMATVGVS